MSDELEGGSGKQVIARAAAVLKALENQPQGLSLSQVAKAAELPKTTAHRIIAALEAQQLVITGPGGVKLGPALARLAAAAHTDVIGIARPLIEALGRRTRETVDLCVFRGLHAISVDQYSSDQELRVVSPTGTAFPCHCTAHGKALLASLEAGELDSLFRGITLEKRTAASISSLPALKTELEQIRAHGFAIDREEHARGVCGIGVTIRTGMTERYAMSIAVPALRFDENLERLQAALMQCKAEIEAVTGPAK